MSSLMVPPHEVRASEGDLLAIARVWQWESTVRRQLPEVLANGSLKVLFQTIFELRGGIPLAVGYEALARFPVAPRIPVGLWFRIAHEMGLARDLELTAARKAVDALPNLPEDSFLCVNASLKTVEDLVDHITPQLTSRLVVDISFTALTDPRCKDVVWAIRRVGAEVAVDDVPLADLHNLRTALLDLRPDFVKVDVIGGLTDSPMTRFNLADGATWCQDAGIVLVAERVGKATDLAVLYQLGVVWAQGYSLARPVEPEAYRSR